MCRAEIWAASFGTKFGLYIDAFFKEDAFQQRVLVAQHETLIGGMTMSSLEIGQVLLVGSDGLLELLNVLCPTLPEGRLCLAISLLPLFRGCVDRLATPFSLRLLTFGLLLRRRSGDLSLRA